MATIVPAIIPKSFKELREKMMSVADHVDIVQIDVMDGTYTKEKTWPYNKKKNHFEEIISEEEGMPEWKSVNFEVDMMLEEPEEKIEDWVRAGASRIIVHLESANEDSIRSILDDYQGAFVEVGIAMKPSTDTDQIEEYIEDIDFVQLMGNDNVGFSGVELDDKVYEKIREIRDYHPEIPIAVDIGVNFETAPKLVEAGATRLVSGSTIYGSGDPVDAIDELREITSQE